MTMFSKLFGYDGAAGRDLLGGQQDAHGQVPGQLSMRPRIGAEETSQLYLSVSIFDERAGCAGYAYIRILPADLEKVASEGEMVGLDEFVEHFVKPSAARAINALREQLEKAAQEHLLELQAAQRRAAVETK